MALLLVSAYMEMPVDGIDVFPAVASTFRPIVEIELLGPSGTLSCVACLDTGADHCLFPLEYAAEIGLDKYNMQTKEIRGLGGKSLAYYSSIGMRLGGTVVQTTAGFIPELTEIGFGVLGQSGFFDHYTATFDLRHNEFRIET